MPATYNGRLILPLDEAAEWLETPAEILRVVARIALNDFRYQGDPQNPIHPCIGAPIVGHNGRTVVRCFAHPDGKSRLPDKAGQLQPVFMEWDRTRSSSQNSRS